MAAGFKSFNVGHLRQGIAAWESQIHAAVVDAVEETAVEGRDDVLHGIVNAPRTPTGDARAAKGGGIQGRVDTGKMYADVDYDVEYTGDEITARWGWTKNFEDYYGYQEDGTRRIQGMGALGNSFVKAVDRIGARLSRIARG